MLTGAQSTPVYRLRPAAGVDSVGDPVLDHAAATRTRIPRAQFQPRASTTADGVVIVQRDRGDLLIVGRYDLTATDRVEVDDAVWRLDGDPIVRQSLASGPLTEAALTRHLTR